MHDNTKFAVYEAKCYRAAQLAAEILPANKALLFNALDQAGIAKITIDFEGSGDSGQFERPTAYDAEEKELPIPTIAIVIQAVDFERGTITTVETTLPEFLETLACSALEERHSGWEDNEGAYGQFRFSTTEQTIKLECWERYIETDYHEHEI